MSGRGEEAWSGASLSPPSLAGSGRCRSGVSPTENRFAAPVNCVARGERRSAAHHQQQLLAISVGITQPSTARSTRVCDIDLLLACVGAWHRLAMSTVTKPPVKVKLSQKDEACHRLVRLLMRAYYGLEHVAIVDCLLDLQVKQANK